MDGDNEQLAVKQTDPRSQLKRNKKEEKKKKKKPLKVVYISNPLKVTLEPSEFKKKVQELTGRHSDVADIMFRKSVVASDPPEEEVEEEVGLGPVASTDVQGSTSTMSSSGASDPSRDDFMPFDLYCDMGIMSFTDLSYDGGFRDLDAI